MPIRCEECQKWHVLGAPCVGPCLRCGRAHTSEERCHRRGLSRARQRILRELGDLGYLARPLDWGSIIVVELAEYSTLRELSAAFRVGESFAAGARRGRILRFERERGVWELSHARSDRPTSLWPGTYTDISEGIHVD